VTPFQQFRVWVRRASTADRMSATLAAVVVLGLLGWLVVPVHHHTGADDQVSVGASGTGATSPTSAPMAPGAAGTTTAAAAPASGTVAASAPGATSGSPAAAAPAAASGCAAPPGADQGVTATQIKVAISLVNIVGPAGNSTFGVPSTTEQQTDFQQVIDALNASGGVACRKLVPQFFEANPVNSSDLQQKCLDIVQAKPFFVIDTGGFYGSPTTNCFPQHQLPFLGNGRLTASQRDQFYPYLFGQGSVETLYRNAVFALRDRGFFGAGNGFQKLGYFYRSCFPEITKGFLDSLHQAGVAAGQVVSYDLGCPDGFANPSDLQQALLKFRQSGVTHVTETSATQDFANFTKLAQQQGFKPKYGLADDGIVPTSVGSLHPDFDNIAGAIAIDDSRFGEETTPGAVPSAGTARCNAIYQARGRPPVYQQSVGFGGVACGQIWMVVAAIDRAPALRRSALADGLHAARAVDFPYPFGPADFNGPKVTYGGQFWRPVQFVSSCSCWRLADAAFHPSFP